MTKTCKRRKAEKGKGKQEINQTEEREMRERKMKE